MGMKLDAKTRKTLQHLELGMLEEIDRICRKNGIQYSLDGGTLLGAVRHQGFIPWDEDADVVMLRSEYEKFRKACQTDLDTERYFLQDHRSDSAYRWGYAKLRCNGTKMVRPGQEHMGHQGVFLDIFVNDNVPDGWLTRRVHYLGCVAVRKLQYSAVGANQEDTPFKRCAYRILSLVPVKWGFLCLHALARIPNRKKTKLVSHYTYAYPTTCRFGLPRSCFDSLCDVEFEGRRFLAFSDYDAYLRPLYGDYMILPPEDRRKSMLELSEIELPMANR